MRKVSVNTNKKRTYLDKKNLLRRRKQTVFMTIQMMMMTCFVTPSRRHVGVIAMLALLAQCLSPPEVLNPVRIVVHNPWDLHAQTQR